MAESLISISLLSVVISTLVSITFCSASTDDRKVYIVYMGALPQNQYSPLAHHHSILQEVLQHSLPSDALIHSYKRSFNGFAANLTDRERLKLSNMEGILSVFPSRKIKLHTTRSWDFMGFKSNVKRIPMIESDVIVGVIDTGIWPEAESFNDEGFGPPPKKWKGSCQGGKNFTCNRKLIGARFYSSLKDENHNSARDTMGHGTHTASTIAGNQVSGASLNGLGQGTTRGAVPSARIAVYKVCWNDNCEDAGILAAFDDAIADGVDILSVSLGGDSAVEYHFDPISIGAFHAMQKGILTSQSAGNDGPSRSSVASVAPWKLSVAASNTDRQYITKVILGGKTTFVGKSVSPFDMKGKTFPLVDYFDPSLDSCNQSSGRLCAQSHLGTGLRGKIIMHNYLSLGSQELHEKAAGMIIDKLTEYQYNDYCRNFPLPASMLNTEDGETIISYAKKTKNPVATILKTEAIRNASSLVVASFSGRGPNAITKEILKPDISAPGVEILAAWSPEGAPSGVPGDERVAQFNILSGTSMACPHATGAAAYVKTFHPDWSPSAIKSSLMTTAFSMKASINPDADLAYGAGHINPIKAINPGLVYEALESDYLKMLCNIGYTTKQIRTLSGHNSNCSKHLNGSPRDLNYPSMISDVAEANFTRTVTNVGVANSTYTAKITSPPTVKIKVTPEVLSFKSLNEKKSFVVRASRKVPTESNIFSASLVWSDGIHHVRSPIVVY
ncbi:Subtilisin-like protease [Thalictrum thalictroides]|uniref:Subtilisin-like protease n=1 Tax=Thalictrum thalictroides TaxID=46969 RepID=A0A7J6XB39_THATH|nr:Subtilisin-like protease [Thalictrum thalictroides]